MHCETGVLDLCFCYALRKCNGALLWWKGIIARFTGCHKPILQYLPTLYSLWSTVQVHITNTYYFLFPWFCVFFHQDPQFKNGCILQLWRSISPVLNVLCYFSGVKTSFCIQYVQGWVVTDRVGRVTLKMYSDTVTNYLVLQYYNDNNK